MLKIPHTQHEFLAINTYCRLFQKNQMLKYTFKDLYKRKKHIFQIWVLDIRSLNSF